jgi:cell division protein FtsI (penicillin-binding protein 3)
MIRRWSERIWARRKTAQSHQEGAKKARNVRSVMYSPSPLLASKTPPWRSKFLVGLVGLGFGVLAGRAAYIQIIGNDFFIKQGEARYARTLELTASRGRIFDRNKKLLAVSVPAPSLWAIPKEFYADKRQLQKLAGLLELPLAELQERLDDSPNYVWLRRQVDEPLAKQVMALGIKGVFQSSEFRRDYPYREAAAHLVGFTNAQEHGQEGIELAFQTQLQGQNGSRRVVKNRLGGVVQEVGDAVPSVDGADIELSIDATSQSLAYQRIRDAVLEHKAKAGSVVVLDAQTGQVLAMANYPSYVPGDRRRLSGPQLRNRALTDVFEPGSTMKPFIAAWALETGRVNRKTVIQTAPGRLVIHGATVSDAHPHGDLTVEQVIQKSSNVGTVKMAMQMQPKEMWELFSQVGFGQRPQINFPGAVTGRLRPYKSWRPIEQATMSYGYGLSTSLFQLARAYTLFAHDGAMLPVSLLKPMAGSDAAQKAAPEVRIISKKTAQTVREMLQMAAGEGGTAPKAQTIGYSVGGKSGTAHKQEGRGYADKKYRSWFVGMAPIGQPRVVVAVMLDEPSAGKYFGGEVAAPVFSDIVQKTLRSLGVPPDLEVQPQILAQQLPAVQESF